MRAVATVAVVATLGCSSAPSPTAAPTPAPTRRGIPLLADLDLPDVSAGEPNGADDASHARAGAALSALAEAPAARFESIGAPDTAHPLVCDLLGFRDALYAAHTVRPVVRTGARIHRYDGAAWSMAFEWDRTGSQGFTRMRAIADRIYVPDADTPGPGFGLSDAPYEEYLFISDADGGFDKPETRVAPLSFHAFDVIAYRGALVMSGGTGVIAPGQWGPFPGGLWAGDADSDVLPLRFELGKRSGVVRTTYMHRFRGRLYVGFMNNERRARWDLAVLSGDPRDPATAAPVIARVTDDGGWCTHRFASTADTLYWIATGYRQDGRGAALFASTDGQRFERLALPDGAGDVQDIAIVDDVRYVLARGGLYRAGANHAFERIAPAPEDDPWGVYNTYCSAPLAVWNDGLYAGSKRNGHVYRVVTAAAPR